MQLKEKLSVPSVISYNTAQDKTQNEVKITEANDITFRLRSADCS